MYYSLLLVSVCILAFSTILFKERVKALSLYPLATLALLLLSPFYLFVVFVVWLASGQSGFDFLLWIAVKYSIPLYPVTQEDSRIERELLNQKGKTLVTICASGDRVLESMAQAPKKVVAVDLNPAQLALLDLKLAAIKILDYEDVVAIFHGMDVEVLKRYLPRLMPQMRSQESVTFWKQQGAEYLNCLYKKGASGVGMRLCQKIIHWGTGLDINMLITDADKIHILWEKEWRQTVLNLLNYLFHVPFAWKTVTVPVSLALGVPPSQGSLRGCICQSPQAAIKYFDRILGSKYFKYNTEFVAGQLGFYTEEKPYWLKEENIAVIKQHVDCVRLAKGYMTNILRTLDENSVDFLLLSDHLDWMSQNQILEEWREIQRVANPGCEVMWRTAGLDEVSYPHCLAGLEYKNQERLDTFLDQEDRLPSYRHHHAIVPPSKEFTIQPRVEVEPKRSLLSDFKNLYYIFFKAINGKIMKLQGKTIENWSEFFYRGQAKTYDSFRHKMLHGRKSMMGVLPIKKGTVWADIGCGTGFNLEYLSDWVASDDCEHLYLVDYSPSMLKQAKRRVEQLGVAHKTSFIECDCSLGIKLPEGVNLITFSYSLCMIPGWEKAMRSAVELLKPGGHIATCDFTVTDEQTSCMRTFWRHWFRNDHVFLNEKHLEVLGEITDTKVRVEKFGTIPYVPFFKVPYYFYLGMKPTKNENTV